MHREIDCLIVGSGVGGLTCGIVLAQQEWRVLILTEHPLEDSFCWVGGGMHHERSPELWWGWEEGGPLHRVLTPRGEQPTLIPIQPGIQVVHPHHRLSFYGEESDWRRELRREFPDSWRTIFNCSEHLRGMSDGLRWTGKDSLRHMTFWGRARLIGRRRLGRFLRSVGATLPFCHMAEAVAAACFQVEPFETTVAMGAVALGHVRRGLFAPSAGPKGLAEQLISRFQRLGGQIRIGAVGEVARTRGAIRRVAMMDGGVVTCRSVVVESEPNHGSRTFHVVLDEELIPGEMGRNVVCVDLDPTAESPTALLYLTVGRGRNLESPSRRKGTVAVRVLQAPPDDPMERLKRAFPGWEKATICSPVGRRQRADRRLLVQGRLRSMNVRVISQENHLGRGVSAAAWNGYRVAARLLSRW